MQCQDFPYEYHGSTKFNLIQLICYNFFSGITYSYITYKYDDYDNTMYFFINRIFTIDDCLCINESVRSF